MTHDLEYMTAAALLAYIARDMRALSLDQVARQRDGWQRTCRQWLATNRDNRTDDEAYAVIRFIATERCEESSENVAWQRDDWQERCAALHK